MTPWPAALVAVYAAKDPRAGAIRAAEPPTGDCLPQRRVIRFSQDVCNDPPRTRAVVMWDPFSWSLSLGRVRGINVRMHVLFPVVALGLILRIAFKKDVIAGTWIDASML